MKCGACISKVLKVLLVVFFKCLFLICTLKPVESMICFDEHNFHKSKEATVFF